MCQAVSFNLLLFIMFPFTTLQWEYVSVRSHLIYYILFYCHEWKCGYHTILILGFFSLLRVHDIRLEMQSLIYFFYVFKAFILKVNMYSGILNYEHSDLRVIQDMSHCSVIFCFDMQAKIFIMS